MHQKVELVLTLFHMTDQLFIRLINRSCDQN